MKTIKQITFMAIFSFIAWSCEQDTIMLLDPVAVAPSTPSGSAGGADFTKFSAIGGSYTAGFMNGALYTDGQNNSLAKIVANQINYTRSADDQATYTFNQPDINSENGYSGPGPDGATGTPETMLDDLGRVYLGTSAATGETGVYYKPGDASSIATPYTGDKTALNNFSFGNSVMGMFLSGASGGPALAANPVYNSYFARFCADCGVASPLAQMMGTAPSFFMAWLGHSDFFAYAARGGDIAQVPKPSGAVLTAYFESGINAMVGGNPIWKGIVGTVPDVLALPFFNLVPYNPVPMDAASATAANAGFASFNTILTVAAGAGLLTTAEAAARQLVFAAGANALVINDSSLTNLLPVWTALVPAVIPPDDLNMNGIPDAIEQLAPFAFARMATANDKPLLSAQPVIGTAGPYPSTVIGVSWPMDDQYILTGAELLEFETERATLNAGIKAKVAAANAAVPLNVAGVFNRVAIAEFDGAYAAMAASSPWSDNGVVVTYDFIPPTGMWSVDAVHPNKRGYVQLANKWIDAINAHFGSSIPKAQTGWYAPAPLPVAEP